MKAELTRLMYLTLNKFAKEQGLKMGDKEFLVALKNVFTSIAHTETPNAIVADKQFSNLHEEIVQKCIDFIKNNPKLQNDIAAKIKEVKKDLMGLEPDVRMYFGIDNLDESVKKGMWVPATDSYLSVTVGNEAIIESF